MLEKMEKNKTRMAMRCINQHGEVVVDGEAIASAASRVEDIQ